MLAYNWTVFIQVKKASEKSEAFFISLENYALHKFDYFIFFDV